MAGCGTSDPNTFHVGCDHFNSVQVGAGLTPTIGWTPDCAVNSIVVVEALTSEDPGGNPLFTGPQMWEARASQIAGNTIEPSIQYGQGPSGALQGSPPLPLVVGQPYVVFISTIAANGSGSASGSVRRFFTP